MDNKIIIFCKIEDGKVLQLKISPDERIYDLINKITDKVSEYKELDIYRNEEKKDKDLLDINLTIKQCGLTNKSTVFVKIKESVILEGQELKEIDIKFLLQRKNKNIPNSNKELSSILKLSLLKEISSKIDLENHKNLPDLIKAILEILKNSYVPQSDDMKEDIKKILKDVKGSNIINFSKFVDNAVDSTQIYNLMNLLSKKDFLEINDIKNRLSRYEKEIKVFDKDFSEALRDSIIEFSVVKLVIIEREDLDIFESEKKECPNLVEKLLFHGTGIEPVASIMTDYFRKSTERCYQHGKGVYFSDKIDYCWFYGNNSSNRINKNKIPEKNEAFTMIACSIYYDKTHWKHVYDYTYTPKKNEINFAYAGAEFETLKELDKKKFYGTEYVIWDLAQICPFLGLKLKRVEYCCIWRDNNFSKDPVYNNEFDEMFKKFLAKRMKYIEQYAEFNIYPCQTTEEAIKLIKRKKYNKIILLSNIGTDLGGKKFVEEARKIIGNDVVVLFLAYNIKHLDWVKDYKNGLFSNDPNFYEEYLQCFSENNQDVLNDDDIIDNILTLKSKMESHYKVKFNFTEDFLEYPLFKASGKYSDLTFD